MANNQLTFNPYQIPSSSTLPPAFNQDYFNTVQGNLGSEFQGQANNLFNFERSSNLLRPQDNTSDILGQVLGSPQDIINSQVMPQALNAASLGQNQGFQTQYESQQFQDQLALAQQQYENERALVNLQYQLMPHGYKKSFGQVLGSGLASDLGAAGDIFAGGALSSLL